MKYNFRNLSVDYETLGTGDPIILLHGWGTNKNTFLPLAKLLSKNYEVHLIDLLGFGKSEAPYKALSLSDYVMLLRDYTEYKRIVVRMLSNKIKKNTKLFYCSQNFKI